MNSGRESLRQHIPPPPPEFWLSDVQFLHRGIAMPGWFSLPLCWCPAATEVKRLAGSTARDPQASWHPFHQKLSAWCTNSNVRGSPIIPIHLSAITRCRSRDSGG
ncbi:UNVERIFIED_CONTAM: hypothetical protein K2H54_047345 [Gekko kuhli]